MRNFLAKVDMGVICNSCNYIACTLKMWHEAGYMQLGNIKVAGTVGKTSCPIAPCSCVKYSEGKVCTSHSGTSLCVCFPNNPANPGVTSFTPL